MKKEEEEVKSNHPKLGQNPRWDMKKVQKKLRQSWATGGSQVKTFNSVKIKWMLLIRFNLRQKLFLRWGGDGIWDFFLVSSLIELFPKTVALSLITRGEQREKFSSSFSAQERRRSSERWRTRRREGPFLTVFKETLAPYLNQGSWAQLGEEKVRIFTKVNEP